MNDNDEWEFKRYSYLEGNSEDPSNMRTVSFKTREALPDKYSFVTCTECPWHSSPYQSGNLSAPGESPGAEYVHEEMRVHGNEHFADNGWPIHER